MSTSRRSLLVAVPAVALAAAAPVAAVAVDAGRHPDAALIALGAEFDRRHAEWLQVLAEAQPVFDAYDARLDELSASEPSQKDDWKTVGYETGHWASVDKVNALTERLEEVCKKIREIPAKTIAGFAVKVRVPSYDCNFSDRFDEPEDDMDWDVLCFLNFMRDADRLAGLSA